MDGSARNQCEECDDMLSLVNNKPSAARGPMRAWPGAFNPAAALAVERKIPFRTTKVEKAISALPVHRALSKREYLARQIFCGGGWFPWQTTVRLLERLPDSLVDAVMEGVTAITTLHPEMWGGTSEHLEEQRAPTFTLEILEESGPDLYFELHADFRSHSVTTVKFCRRTCHERLGISEEEAVSRMLSGDVDVPLPELEYVTYVIDCFIHTLEQQSFSSFNMWSPGRMAGQASTSAVLIRDDTTATARPDGVVEMKSRGHVLSAEDYDRQRITTPARCRPFLAEIGDLRSARQLRADRPRDNASTIANLLRSGQGSGLMRELTAVMRRRFAPYVTASRAASPALSRPAHTAPSTPLSRLSATPGSIPPSPSLPSESSTAPFLSPPSFPPSPPPPLPNSDSSYLGTSAVAPSSSLPSSPHKSSLLSPSSIPPPPSHFEGGSKFFTLASPPLHSSVPPSPLFSLGAGTPLNHSIEGGAHSKSVPPLGEEDWTEAGEQGWVW